MYVAWWERVRRGLWNLLIIMDDGLASLHSSHWLKIWTICWTLVKYLYLCKLYYFDQILYGSQKFLLLDQLLNFTKIINTDVLAEKIQSILLKIRLLNEKRFLCGRLSQSRELDCELQCLSQLSSLIQFWKNLQSRAQYCCLTLQQKAYAYLV